MAALSPNYKRWMGGRMKEAIGTKSIKDALTLIEIWPDIINEDVRYKFWVEQTLKNAIETGDLATVQQIVNTYPPIINEGDITPLMWTGILCGFLLDLKAEPARIEQLHQIALFLVRHPMIDVLKYRAGSATNRACYYCMTIDNDEFRRLLYEKEVAAGSPGKLQCARFLGIRPPVAVAPVGGAGGAPAAPPSAPVGQVMSAVPIPKRGPGARTPAEIAAAASREAGGENANWESIVLEERAMKGGRRHTVKKSKQQKRRYRKSQRHHFL